MPWEVRPSDGAYYFVATNPFEAYKKFIFVNRQLSVMVAAEDKQSITQDAKFKLHIAPLQQTGEVIISSKQITEFAKLLLTLSDKNQSLHLNSEVRNALYKAATIEQRANRNAKTKLCEEALSVTEVDSQNVEQVRYLTRIGANVKTKPPFTYTGKRTTLHLTAIVAQRAINSYPDSPDISYKYLRILYILLNAGANAQNVLNDLCAARNYYLHNSPVEKLEGKTIAMLVYFGASLEAQAPLYEHHGYINSEAMRSACAKAYQKVYHNHILEVLSIAGIPKEALKNYLLPYIVTSFDMLTSQAKIKPGKLLEEKNKACTKIQRAFRKRYRVRS